MYWNPWDEIERMHKEMDRLFGSMFEYNDKPLIGHRGGKYDLVNSEHRTPRCHVQETENNIEATFELPGVQKKDIELNITDESAEIKVEKKIEKKEGKGENKSYYSHAESFYRSITFPKPVDSSKATAEYENGVLRLKAPKKEKESGGRRLQIN